MLYLYGIQLAVTYEEDEDIDVETMIFFERYTCK